MQNIIFPFFQILACKTSTSCTLLPLAFKSLKSLFSCFYCLGCTKVFLLHPLLDFLALNKITLTLSSKIDTTTFSLFQKMRIIKIQNALSFVLTGGKPVPLQGHPSIDLEKFSMKVEKILNWSFQRSEASKALKSRLCSFCELPAW